MDDKTLEELRNIYQVVDMEKKYLESKKEELEQSKKVKKYFRCINELATLDKVKNSILSMNDIDLYLYTGKCHSNGNSYYLTDVDPTHNIYRNIRNISDTRFISLSDTDSFEKDNLVIKLANLENIDDKYNILHDYFNSLVFETKLNNSDICESIKEKALKL